MYNSSDYYSIMLARKLFQQSQQQRAEEQNIKTAVTVEDIIPAAHLQTDPYAYSIFHNPGCGYGDGSELKQASEAFKRRWHAFYPPDPKQLPQHNDLLRLQERKGALYHERAKLYAPRLAVLAISVILVLASLFGGNYALVLLPAIATLWIWAKSNGAVDENNLHLHRNQAWTEQQTQLLRALEKSLAQTKPTITVSKLQQGYTRTLEQFLRDGVAEFFPSLDYQELEGQIRQGEVQLFLLESRGILQVPNACQHSADNFATLEALIQQTGKGLCALQPFPELEGLTRLHYLYGVLCFEQGILLCTGFYDWIGDQIHGVRRDFHTYRNISHLNHTETRFPEINQLRDELPDEVWQTHFSQPVQVISLGLRNGDQHCCTLPKIQPLRKTWLSRMPDTFFTHHLKRDPRQLVAHLTQQLPRQK